MAKVSNFLIAILIGTFIITLTIYGFDQGAAEENYNISVEPRYQDFYDGVAGNRTFISNFSNNLEKRLQESKSDSIISDAFLSVELLSIFKSPISFIGVLLSILTGGAILIGLPSFILSTIITLIIISIVFMIINAWRGGQG